MSTQFENSNLYVIQLSGGQSINRHGRPTPLQSFLDDFLIFDIQFVLVVLPCCLDIILNVKTSKIDIIFNQMWQIANKYDTQKHTLDYVDHRFLTWGPWRGSRGSVNITKVTYCTLINLFYRYSGVH